MDAFAFVIISYYIYTGLAIIGCIFAYLWIPKTIKVIFNEDRSDNDKSKNE
jgi:hypothetical protein